MISLRYGFNKPVTLFGLVLLLAGCGGTAPVKTEVDATVIAAAGDSGEMPIADQNQKANVNRKAEAAFVLALDSLRAGDFDNAARQFYNLTRDYPEYPGPYANLGLALERTQDYQNAAIALRHAINLAPNWSEPYNILGLVYRQEGKFQQALEIYQQGLQAVPDSKNLLRNTGILLELYMHAPDQALKYYQEYLALEPNDEKVQTWISDIQIRSGG